MDVGQSSVHSFSKRKIYFYSLKTQTEATSARFLTLRSRHTGFLLFFAHALLPLASGPWHNCFLTPQMYFSLPQPELISLPQILSNKGKHCKEFACNGHLVPTSVMYLLAGRLSWPGQPSVGPENWALCGVRGIALPCGISSRFPCTGIEQSLLE